MRKRPGVMLYFDLRPSLKLLSTEDRGRLFDAILDYAELGVVPELDGMLAMAWEFIRPRIDKDGERYERQIAQRQYAVYSREAKRRGETPLSFDDWCKSGDSDSYRPIMVDDESYPNTKPTTDQPQPQRIYNEQHTTQPQFSTATEGAGAIHTKNPEQEFEDRRRAAISAVASWL